ncbi:hypothetical protein [Sinorhizobium meliloti]|nr:hypothetical protein [Sinorhizobium meliloti]
MSPESAAAVCSTISDRDIHQVHQPWGGPCAYAKKQAASDSAGADNTTFI